jgi:glycosyltransferase involved in cell wall biosynthesis
LRQLVGQRAVVVANAPQGLDVWPEHDDAQVIGNGIDFQSIASVPRGQMSDIEPFRGRIGIVTLSRLIEDKKIDTLISAIGIAKPAVPNIRLIVIGDGPDRERLEKLVLARDLNDHVVFEGLRTHPLEWLRSAHMFASASLFEGHPNAVTEAAASGVPTILSDITMHRSLMGNAALYAPPGDASAFAAHFVMLARDPVARDEISAAGRDAVARFDIDAIAACYIALYQRLTPPPPGGR